MRDYCGNLIPEHRMLCVASASNSFGTSPCTTSMVLYLLTLSWLTKRTRRSGRKMRDAKGSTSRWNQRLLTAAVVSHVTCRAPQSRKYAASSAFSPNGPLQNTHLPRTFAFRKSREKLSQRATFLQ